MSVPPKTMGEHGFGLTELLAVLSISLILALAALSGIADFQRSFSRNNAVQQVEEELARSRSEALAQGMRVIVDLQGDGFGYIVGLDRYPYSASLDADEALFSRPLPNLIKMNISQKIVFDPRGFVVDTSGDPTTIALSLIDNNYEFSAGTVYSTGHLAWGE